MELSLVNNGVLRCETEAEILNETVEPGQIVHSREAFQMQGVYTTGMSKLKGVSSGTDRDGNNGKKAKSPNIEIDLLII